MPRLPRYREFSISNFLKKFQSYLVLILVAIIGSIATLLTDLTQKLVLFVILAICIVLVLLFLYYKESLILLNSLAMNMSAHECIAPDLTFLKYEKNVTFDNNSRTQGCLVKESRYIRNNMDHEYNRFLFKFSEELPGNQVPRFQDFTFYNHNDEIVRFTEGQTDFKSYIQNDPTDPITPVDKVATFYYPEKIPRFDKRKFSIEYRTIAYNFAINHDLDYTQIQINTITEKLMICVKLTEEMKNQNILSYPISERRPENGETYEWEITDNSGQRMWNSEENLIRIKSTPEFLNDNSQLVWIIYHPKIGYKYRVYFTLIPKNPPAP